MLTFYLNIRIYHGLPYENDNYSYIILIHFITYLMFHLFTFMLNLITITITIY